MSEKKLHAQPGDKVELKDKEGGFTDPETGFDISRDQRAELGDTVGERTQQAVLSGGLLIVGGKAPKAKTEKVEKTETAENADDAAK